MQPETRTCPQCGKVIEGRKATEPCPHCLMALGMKSSDVPTVAPNSNLDAYVPLVERVDAAFPDLEICHLVGQGGMGVVYQARQVNLDRVVALKILSPRLAQDPTFSERFLREAQTMAKLSHPNIVTVFDFGQVEDFYYLTMEFVDGVNLRDTIATNKISAAEALTIVPQLCEALQYAHDKGVVHRDIKPENILIDKDGSIKIADFGLAKMLDPNPNQVSLTATQQVLGTRNYMAPEQLESPEAVDHRADLYSLGVVFYELLTGELPLGRFALPSEKRPYVSSRLDDVVMRTLEKDPGRRFQQASQIKTACESLDQPAASATTPEPAETTAKPLALGPPLPVSLEDLYASLASAEGLIRGFETHLELEFEVRDAVVAHRWASNRVEIPLERIASVILKNRWMNSYIEFQADQFDAVKDIPSSQQGKFRVYFKKKDRELAEQFVWQIQKRIGMVPQEYYAPTPPVKHGVAQPAGTQQDSSHLIAKIIVFSILGIGLVFALGTATLALYWGVKQEPHRTEQRAPIQSSAGESIEESSKKDKSSASASVGSEHGATEESD